MARKPAGVAMPASRSRPAQDMTRVQSGTAPRATWLIVLFWLALGVTAYLAFSAVLRPDVGRATVTEGGTQEVVIERSRDGHYYVSGTVNGTPVTFMVDTGASTVALGANLARKARLPRGERMTTTTAGGNVPSEMVRDIRVTVAGIGVAGLRVAVIPAMGNPEHALLGQNFLRHLTVTQSGDRMVLRVPHPG